jgi:hypothetical protein
MVVPDEGNEKARISEAQRRIIWLLIGAGIGLVGFILSSS